MDVRSRLLSFGAGGGASLSDQGDDMSGRRSPDSRLRRLRLPDMQYEEERDPSGFVYPA